MLRLDSSYNSLSNSGTPALQLQLYFTPLATPGTQGFLPEGVLK